MKRLTIVQPGQKLSSLVTVAGDFAEWIAQGMGLAAAAWQVVRPHEGDALPAQADAVVISGSSAMVTDRDPWILELEHWLSRMHRARVPLLGICFGHQALASALGGRVTDNPNGVEVGTVQVSREPEKDPLLADLPDPFRAQASHRQAVVTLPPGAVRLAHTDLDPNHAFRLGELTWGVQFHPEFSAEIVASYIDYYAEDLGDRLPELQRGVRPGELEGSVLRAFAGLAGLKGS